MKLSLLLPALAAISAAQTPLAALDHGSVYEMSWLSDHWSCRIYMTPAKAGDALTASIREVTMGTRSTAEFLNSFAALLPFPQAGEVRAFDILTVPGAKLSRGTYDVGLELHSGKASEVKSVQLTIPAAAIAAQPLVVSRSTGWLLFPAESDNLPALSVRETANKSFAQLSVQQTDQASNSDGTYSGRLVFDPTAAEARVAPNLPGSLKYKVEGDFPVGTAKVNLGIYSDQLESAVVVPVEVRTRVTRAALIALLLAGLALGFFTRGLLKQRVELGQAKRQALDQAAKLKSARDNIPDKTFRALVDAAERSLLQEIENAHTGPQDGLKGAVTTAENALSEAVKKLNERITEHEGDLKTLREFLQTSWILPMEFMAALGSMRTDTQRAGELLEARNAVAAETLITGTQIALRKFLIEAVGRWKTTLGDMGPVLDTIGKLVEAGTPFADELKKLRDAAGGLNPPAVSAKLADLGKTLDAVHMVLQQALALSLNLSTAVLATFDRMNSEFHDFPRTRLLWASLHTHTQQFCERLPRTVDDLDLFDGEAATVAEALRAQWRRALATESTSKKALALFDQGQYADAAKEARKNSRAKIRQQSYNAGDMVREGFADEPRPEEEEPADADGPWWLPSSGRTPMRRAAIDRSIAKLDLPAALEALRTRTLGDLYRAQLGMGIVSTIGLTIVGYFLFADKWTGSSTDMLKVFFWGFTTDIGVDALINVGKKFGTAD